MASSNRTNGMLTASQVARQLEINVNTVLLWSKLGVLKPYPPGANGDRKYKPEEIESFLGKR